MKPKFTIAIAGNPNSGKTTMFNSLTGSRHSVGNYPGITVEKREGRIKRHDKLITAIDLPGTYSLTAYSQEELVARNILVEEKPDVVIDVINTASLERNLYLAVQLLELGIPTVLALNMMDEVSKQGITINTRKLAELLNIPVVETVARTGKGKEELLQATVELAETAVKPWNPLKISYGPDLDPVLKEMTELIEAENFLPFSCPARWIALKYLEQDAQILELGSKQGDLHKKLAAMVESVSNHCRTTLNTDPESIIADYRYGMISSVIKQQIMHQENPESRRAVSDTIDTFLTNKFLGPVLMIAVFYAMFKITFSAGELPMKWLELFFSLLGDLVSSAVPEGLLRSLLVSGIIDGVGGVLGFVPLILLMFLMITFLEDSGYMARMAYMLDRVFRTFGLHGSSVMPFIISGGIPGGCAVPGVMATRTLRSPKEKLATLLTVPFMTCGAKVPVIILLTAAFFPESRAEALLWVTLGSWALALLIAWFLRSTIIRGTPTPFVMELPPYRLPTLKGLVIHTTERIWQYIKKAGTVILLISILLWAAMTFPDPPEETSSGSQVEKLKYSLAGRIGRGIEPVTELAGFNWRTNIALIGGVAAKEIIVSTLGTAYSIGKAEQEETEPLARHLANDPEWSPLVAVALIIFVMLYSPCSVTVVMIARESSWRWAVFSVVFNTAVAFAAAVAVYQTGTLLG